MIRKIFWIFTVVMLVTLAVGNYTTLMEAYGSVSPHYGRTTNMDKWIDPWEHLGVINVFGIAVLGFSVQRLRTYKRL